MLTNLMLFYMQWPQNAKTMENYLSKIHQSQRMILILETHSIVFLQQPDYDFIGKSSLFLKAQLKTEAEEVNKRQVLCFTRASLGTHPAVQTCTCSSAVDWVRTVHQGRFCLQRCIWPFCFALYFIPEVVLILPKHPKHCCHLLKLMQTAEKTGPTGKWSKLRLKPYDQLSPKQNQQKWCPAR